MMVWSGKTSRASLKVSTWAKKKTGGFVRLSRSAHNTPEAWAAHSIRRAPGMRGRPGKWSRKKGRLKGRNLKASIVLPSPVILKESMKQKSFPCGVGPDITIPSGYWKDRSDTTGPDEPQESATMTPRPVGSSDPASTGWMTASRYGWGVEHGGSTVDRGDYIPPSGSRDISPAVPRGGLSLRMERPLF